MALSKNTGGFTSNLGAIAAAAGSAIGLGNIWRFPYTVGQYGGGAFLLVYLLFVFLIGVPIMMSELSLGRRSGANAVASFRVLSPKRKGWAAVGIWGIITVFLIYSFYSTVTGWTLNYVVEAASGGLSADRVGDFSQFFQDFATHPYKPLIYQFIFLALSALVVVLGVQKGIEGFSKVLMPILFVLMIVLCIRSLTLPGASAGVEFLFKPDFSKLNGVAILSALGQAMFSLSIGLGVLITYGAYVRKEDNLFKTSLCIASMDTLVAILSGVAIFPAVFAFGMSPTSGPSLVYEVLPNVFNSMSGGVIFATLFFLLLSIAALSSTISMHEALVYWLMQDFKMKRGVATTITTIAVFVFGTLCTLSFSVMSDFNIFGRTIFDLLDHLTATYMLPIGALGIIIFLAWRLPKVDVHDELSNSGKIKARFFDFFYFMIRFVAPVAVFIVLIAGMFGLGQ